MMLQPIIPGNPVVHFDGTVSEGWRFTKREINNCLAAYLKQRYNAYKATGTLSIERAMLINEAKKELNKCSDMSGRDYARSIGNIVAKLYAILPNSEPLLSSWLFKLSAISQWTNKF
jgi:hypothetical protein